MFFHLADVKGFLRRHTDPDIRRLFLASIRQLKSFCLFDVVPTAEQLNALRPIERSILEEIWEILPATAIESPSVAYAAVADPLSLFPAYCRLSQLYEMHGYPMFVAIPLRTSHIQCHAMLDTKTLCAQVLALPDNDATRSMPWDFHWGQVVDLRNGAFKGRRGMKFRGTLSTNGFEVSIHLSHPDAPSHGTPHRRKSKAQRQAEVADLYFDRHLDEIRAAANIVCIDSNRRDILYCQDLKNHDSLRYTSMQRTKESGSRLFQYYRQTMRRWLGIDLVESVLPTSKTMQPGAFDHYLLTRAAAAPFIKYFYGHPIHRQWKCKTYINTQRSEQAFINRMKDTYGKSGPFVVVFGDWSDHGHTPRFQAPTKTIGWRKVFARQHVSFIFLLKPSIPPFCSLHCICHN